jgi:protein-disulfide isomerase
MIALFVALSFFAGSLWSKNKALEQAVQNNNGGTGNTAQAPVKPAEMKITKPSADKDHWIGNKDARYVFVEYSDLECPFCKKAHPDVVKLRDTYAGKMAFVYRHFPLSFHQNAAKEAEATECATQLGGNDAFWKYSDTIFDRTTSNGTGFALADLGPLAAEIGLNQQDFQQCLDTGKFTQKVTDSIAEGSKAGVQATPSFVVYDMKSGKSTLIEGAITYDSIKSTVDDFMKQQGS